MDNQPPNYGNDVFPDDLELVVSKGGFLPEGLGSPEYSPFPGVTASDMEIFKKTDLFFRNFRNLDQLIVEIAENSRERIK